jgi:hypothetical protein
MVIGPSAMMHVAPAGTVTVPYVPGASVEVHVVALAAEDVTVSASVETSAIPSAISMRRISLPSS